MKKLSVLLTLLLAVLTVHVSYGWNDGDPLYIRGDAFGGVDNFVKLTKQQDGNYVSETAVTQAGWSKMKFNDNTDWNDNDVISYSTEKDVTQYANDSNNNIVFSNSNNMNFPSGAVGKYVYFLYNSDANKCQMWYGDAPQGGDLYITGAAIDGNGDWGTNWYKMTKIDGKFRSPETVSEGGFLLSTMDGWDGKRGATGDSNYTLTDTPAAMVADGDGKDFEMPNVSDKYVWVDLTTSEIWYGDATLDDEPPLVKIYGTGENGSGFSYWGNWDELKDMGDNLFRSENVVPSNKQFVLSTSKSYDDKFCGVTLTATPQKMSRTSGVNLKMGAVSNKYVWFQYDAANPDNSTIWYGESFQGETISFYLNIGKSVLGKTDTWANGYAVMLSDTDKKYQLSSQGNNLFKVTIPKDEADNEFAFIRQSITNPTNATNYERSAAFTPEDGHTYTLYLTGSYQYYNVQDLADVTTPTTITPETQKLWVRGAAFGGINTYVEMEYMGENIYKTTQPIKAQGTFRITKVNGSRLPADQLGATALTSGNQSYIVPVNASESANRITGFGVPGYAFGTNANMVQDYVFFLYDDDPTNCRIWSAEEISDNVEYGYSVISEEWGWKGDLNKGKMSLVEGGVEGVDVPDGWKLYSVHVNHMPKSSTNQWSFIRYNSNDPTDDQQEWKLKAYEGDNDSKSITIQPDTQHELIYANGGWNYIATDLKRSATVYFLTNETTNEAKFWYSYDGAAWVAGTPGDYYIRGTILGGWGQTNYAYFGTVNGTKYYGAKDKDGNIYGPSNYAIRTDLDQTIGELRWRPFLANADGKWYMTIDVPEGANVANATWEYGYGDKAWGGRHNGGTLKTNDAYGVSQDDNQGMNKFNASSFQAGKTYLFLFTEGDNNNGTLTVREYTAADRRSYPKFNDTPMEGRWDDENDNHEPLEVAFVRSETEGVYVYDFAPDKYYEIQFTNYNNEPEMHHFNVSHFSGNDFWVTGNTRHDHKPIGDNNTLDLVDGTPLSFKEEGGVGQNFLLTGPAKVYFRHLDKPDADGATGYMWVEPYAGAETDYEAVFTFWDKGGTEYPDKTVYSQWWDDKPTASRKVEIYAKNHEDAPKQIILGGENSQTTRLDSNGNNIGKNRGFSVKLRQDLLTAIGYYTATEDGEDVVRDENGNPVLGTNANGQPVGLWVRIYKDLSDNENYLDRPYAFNAIYTQNVPTADYPDPNFNYYPDNFEPGNPHVEFVASAAPVKVEGVETEVPGGFDMADVKYPYVNQYRLEARVNTRNRVDDEGNVIADAFPFIPVNKEDAKKGPVSETNPDGSYEIVADSTCKNDIPHMICMAANGHKTFWSKRNYVSTSYMGVNQPNATVDGNKGMGELRGFSPRYAKDKDALTVAVRYTSPGMSFTRSQKQNLKSATVNLLADTTIVRLWDEVDDIKYALFYGHNWNADGTFMNRDVLDMIIYNENVIEVPEEDYDLNDQASMLEAIRRGFMIPGSEARDEKGKIIVDANGNPAQYEIFAAYIGYKIKVDRPEDGKIIHNLAPYYQTAYSQGAPVNAAQMGDILGMVKDANNWTNLPDHDPKTWHMLTNPFGRPESENPTNKYIYDHNSLAVHIHHLYCEEVEEYSNDKIQFTSEVPINVQITYEVYLPIENNIRYIRVDEHDPITPTEPVGPQSTKRRAGAVSTQAETPDIVMGDEDDDAFSRFSHSFEVTPSTLDPNELPTVTSVKNVQVDYSDAPVEYYTIQGVRVNAENLTPGIYIRRQGNKATKVAIR